MSSALLLLALPACESPVPERFPHWPLDDDEGLPPHECPLNVLSEEDLEDVWSYEAELVAASGNGRVHPGDRGPTVQVHWSVQADLVIAYGPVGFGRIFELYPDVYLSAPGPGELCGFAGEGPWELHRYFGVDWSTEVGTSSEAFPFELVEGEVLETAGILLRPALDEDLYPQIERDPLGRLQRIAVMTSYVLTSGDPLVVSVRHVFVREP